MTIEKLKINRLLSVIVLILGFLLVTYMIVIEGEPGALPLFIIITGTIWFVISQIQINKNLRKNIS